MSKQFQRKFKQMVLLAGMGALSVLLSGCLPTIRGPADEPFLYDLGALPVVTSGAGVQVHTENMIGIPEISARGAIDSTDIVYRFSNVQTHESRKYTQSRWVGTPAEMLRVRAQQYLGVEHVVVLSTELVARAEWSLLLSLEDFSQHFSSEQDSTGVVQVRAILTHNGTVFEQKIFRVERQAISADAPGAVQALADASDEVLRQMMVWVNERIGSQL